MTNYIKNIKEIEKPISEPTLTKNIDVEQVLDVVNQVSEDKCWWQSKIIITNILVILGSIALSLGIDLQKYGINHETFTTVAGVIIGFFNIYLRKHTNKGIKR
jgi:hypothetical protein